MFDIKIKKTGIAGLITGVYFLLAPFGVSDAINNLIPGVGSSLTTIGATFIFFVLYFLLGNTIKLNKLEKTTILFFILPVALSIIGMFTALLTADNPEYVKYIRDFFSMRMLLITANITIFVGLLSITRNWSFKRIKKLIQKYYWSLLLFTSVGVWQFFHFLLGIPYLDINTRSHIHSVNKANVFYIDGRLTSFAAEPSYFAPVIIDLMIMSFLISKKPIRPFLLGLFVLIFSYSSGGYLNVLILLPFVMVGYLGFKGYKVRKTHVALLGLFLVAGAFILFKYNTEM